MHPALKHFLRAQCRGFKKRHHCHPEARHCGDHGEEAFEGGGGGFGVRRPLRFLAHKLQLDERQIAELARILDTLKTERAQAEVDRRRTVAAFADALGGDTFDAAKAGEAPTVEGSKIKITASGGKVMINNATVVAADLDTSNGVIHVIDTVLLPKPVAEKLSSAAR